MAINRIQGNILADNLIRGTDLAFQTDLLYLDIINGNVGINTTAATHTLTVNGNCNILGPFQANDVYSGNSVSAVGNVSGNVGNFDNLFVGNIDIGNLVGGGNLVVDSLTANLFVSATGDVIGGNLSTVGNVDAGNVNAVLISASGSVIGSVITATGNVVGGNILTGGFISATGNATSGNVFTGGVVSAAGNVVGGNLTTAGDVSAGGNVYAANFSGTGNISLGNLTIANTTISTSLAVGNITLTPTGNAEVFIDTVSGLVMPLGNTLERPSPAYTGTLRFNTDYTRLEVYDGAEWDSVVSDVTNQTINGDGSTITFTLDQSSTTAATLVIINGLVQRPTAAYSIAGNSITFTQAPIFTDVIDIRFL